MLLKDRIAVFQNSKLYLYGAGAIGRQIVTELNYGIDGIFDRRYEELHILNEIPVINTAEILKLNPQKSVLVFSVGMNIANAIMQTLERREGWERNRNLFYYSDFIQNHLAEYKFARGGE